MKKSTKPRAISKKTKGRSKTPKKNLRRAKSHVAVKVAKKSKAPTRSKRKPAAKKKMVSVIELYELKKTGQEQSQQPLHSDQIIPPHDLHEKVNLQSRPQGNGKIG